MDGEKVCLEMEKHFLLRDYERWFVLHLHKCVFFLYAAFWLAKKKYIFLFTGF